MNLVLFLLLLLTLKLMGVVLPYNLPNFGNLIICENAEGFETVMDRLNTIDVMTIGIVSYFIPNDSYLALYLGMLLDLFDFAELPSIVVVYQRPRSFDLVETILHMLNKLPQKSIFVTFEHGMNGFSLANLQTARKQIGYKTRVIFHLNNEQPWLSDASKRELSPSKATNVLDHGYDSIDSLIGYYNEFDLVLRNYYYTPLLEHSFYLPVGPTLFGYAIGNTSSPVFTAGFRPSSQRGIFCKFRGRIKYEYVLFNKNNSNAQSYGADDHVKDRLLLIELSAAGRLGGCVAEEAAPLNLLKKEDQTDRYDSYIAEMADSVFALCPPGNNPETFRHYEALELGAIPIMVKPRDEEQNFMNYGLWKEYPGPVLSSWDQVDEYLRRLTMQEIDELQAAVVSWYARFKADNKAHLLRKLLSVFSPEALSTSSISSQLKEATVKREIGLDLPPEAVEGVGAVTLTESDVSEVKSGADLRGIVKALAITVLGLERRLAVAESELKKVKNEFSRCLT